MKKESRGGKRSARTRGQKVRLGARERRRLIQLGACLLLFLTVFWAKGAGRLGDLRARLAWAITANANFDAAFSDLGWAVAAGRPVGETLEGFWVDAFAPREKAAPAVWREGPLYASTLREMNEDSGVSILLPPQVAQPEPTAILSKAPSEPPNEVPAQTPEPVATEPAVEYVDYDGPELPEHTSMDKYALGLDETVTPVLGRVTSDFGWREHPVDGGEKFHYGVDLSAAEGTEVKAFAAGTVEYIGEDNSYGRYLQVDHGNGVKSFYAHCSKICVSKGQSVAAGEVVAKSGSTGNVTGPHLHFELKKDGVRLEPVYYIETKS